MRNGFANLLRGAVMVALCAMGAVVLMARPEEQEPPPPPPPKRWNDLQSVVSSWEQVAVAAPAAPTGCGSSITLAARCDAADGPGTLTGGEGSCARAGDRWLLELAPGAVGTVRCGIDACMSRPVEIKPDAAPDPTLTGKFTGCDVAWPSR
jgi:hypothetical protein